jgi:hypothetical protein
MDQPELPAIIRAMESSSYRVFKSPKGHDLNIVGIRTADKRANTFNDWLTVFYRFNKAWNYFAFPATTDPGTYYRKQPLNVRGTAVLKPGQYRGAYKVGKHRGYKALQQTGRITVFRDADKNETIDTSGTPDTGIHGINIHRANAHRPSLQVGKWSAGCQVLQDPDHFAFLLALCERGREKFSNSFTYTLLEEGDLE